MTDGPEVAELLDALYRGTTSIVFALFDKRTLLPLTQLCALVTSESGEDLSPARVGEILKEEWIPDLITENGEPGFPLYAPSRVGLLLQLARQGYEPIELRAIASYEEFFIDTILVNEERPYIDDDRELVLNDFRFHIWEHESGSVHLWKDGVEVDQEPELANMRKWVAFLEARQLDSVSGGMREKVGRMAHRIRFFNEMLRVQLLDQLRAQVRAGYSPFLHFSRSSCGPDQEPSFDDLTWEGVLENPWVGDGGLPIRLPEFLLNGYRITMLRPMRPTEYEVCWAKHHLDRYFELLADHRGERRCLQCHTALPADTYELRRYCSPECRQAAKMQRYRERRRTGHRPPLEWEDLR